MEKIHSQVQAEMAVELYELQSRMADATDHAQGRVRYLEQSNHDLLHEVTRLVDVLSERQGQLTQYQREWSKLHRVPASHSFLDTPVCTYHHQLEAGSFGKTKPTGMPQIGQLSEDGCLFLQKNGDQFDRWPVLYYKDH